MNVIKRSRLELATLINECKNTSKDKRFKEVHMVAYFLHKRKEVFKYPITGIIGFSKEDRDGDDAFVEAIIAIPPRSSNLKSFIEDLEEILSAGVQLETPVTLSIEFDGCQSEVVEFPCVGTSSKSDDNEFAIICELESKKEMEMLKNKLWSADCIKYTYEKCQLK